MLHAPESLKILQALWAIGRPATVNDVLAQLLEEGHPERDYRTVGTMLRQLEKSGLAESEIQREMPTRPAPDPRPRIGREKRFYAARVSEPDIARQEIDQLFGLLLRENPELYALLIRRLEERLAELGIAEQVRDASG